MKKFLIISLILITLFLTGFCFFCSAQTKNKATTNRGLVIHNATQGMKPIIIGDYSGLSDNTIMSAELIPDNDTARIQIFTTSTTLYPLTSDLVFYPYRFLCIYDSATIKKIWGLQ